jgi:hypothetical protein
MNDSERGFDPLYVLIIAVCVTITAAYIYSNMDHNPYGIVGYSKKSIYREDTFVKKGMLNYEYSPYVNVKKGDRVIVDIDADIKVGELQAVMMTDSVVDFQIVKTKQSGVIKEVIIVKKDGRVSFNAFEDYGYSSKECRDKQKNKKAGEFIADIFIPKLQGIGSSIPLWGTNYGCVNVDMEYKVTWTLEPAHKI